MHIRNYSIKLKIYIKMYIQAIKWYSEDNYNFNVIKYFQFEQFLVFQTNRNIAQNIFM